jgi:hypothetical protein
MKRYWILVALLLLPLPAKALTGNVCTIIADCLPAVDFDLFLALGAVDVLTPPWTVFADARADLGDPITWCRMDYFARLDAVVSGPVSLTPLRSPSPQPDENIGCMLMPAGTTPFLPTANAQLQCFIEDQTPAVGPSPVLDNLQGELLLDWAVTPGAPDFIGPTLAFEKVVISAWNGSACVPVGSYTDPTESTVTSITVVPEPPPLLAMVAGVGTLALLHRRRHRGLR